MDIRVEKKLVHIIVIDGGCLEIVSFLQEKCCNILKWNKKLLLYVHKK